MSASADGGVLEGNSNAAGRSETEAAEIAVARRDTDPESDLDERSAIAALFQTVVAPDLEAARSDGAPSLPSKGRADDTEFDVAQAAMAADLSRVPIGRVDKISGGATVMRNGMMVQLHLGDPVFKGDVVETATGGGLTVKFLDGTVLALSSGAKVALSEMVYQAGSSANSVLFKLVDGIMGLVAGASAKAGDFAIETPTAIMGIRGTAVRVEILQDGTTKFSLLREPNGRTGSFLLLDAADRSRIIGAVTDARAAVVVDAAGANLTRVTKTNDELRSEGVLVRDLFQSFQNQRRGSGDFEQDLIIPAMETPSPELQGVEPFAPVQTAFVGPVSGFFALEEKPSEIVTRGRASEDGPVTALGPKELDADIRVVRPSALPAGVTFDESSGLFRLDPSSQVFQHLGVGEFATVQVRYTIVDGATVLPAAVSWTVAGQNDTPLARSDSFTVAETGATALLVRLNDADVDGDALRIVSWTSPLEGSLSLRSGQLFFTPGSDFEALSAGQTATLWFDYTIADPFGGTATATARVTVQGKGRFSAPPVSDLADGLLPDTGQAVSIKLETPSRTTSSLAEVKLDIDFGLVPPRAINIVYAIDVSGSTDAAFIGEAVGDLNQDGQANTVLDAEIAGLINLTERIRALGFSPEDVTVTLIPFNGAAAPADDIGPAGEAIVFDLGTAGDESIGNALRNLRSGDGTDFEQALQAALEELADLDPGRQEENFIYFLSDGAGSGSFQDEVATLRTEFGAKIAAVGVGANATLDSLRELDSGGKVTVLTSSGDVQASLVGLPRQSGRVVEIDLFVNDREIAGIGPEDLVRSGDDYLLRLNVEDLARFAGETNTIVATVELSSGVVLTTSVDVLGALPRSTDFDL
jgi:hypothetical protein